MPADPSIFGQYLQAPRSVLEYGAELDAADARRQQNALTALTLGEARGAMADRESKRNALAQLYQQYGTDPDKLAEALSTNPLTAAEGAGLRKAQLETQKTKADIGKTTVETDAKRLDSSVKAHDYHVQLLGQVSTPEQALAWAQEGLRAGVFTPEQYQRGLSTVQQAAAGGPQALEAWKRQAMQAGMSVADQLRQQLQERQAAEVARHNQSSEMIQVRGQDVSASTARRGQDISASTAIRGQDLTDSRSREANANGRVPSGYRAKPDGGLEFIPGGPADPASAKKAAPTEFQGKSAAFGSRAAEADRLITGLQGKYSPLAVNAKEASGRAPLGLGNVLEPLANAALSSEGQQAEQAQRDFINALLRQESGAAIGQSEFDNARKQYFPQPGDGKDVIAQKAANRKRAVQGLVNNAGNATVQPPSDGLPSDISDLLNKYGR